ncbi:DUF2142 domain-containing protein [Curtobacterium sp. MCBD17_003]|uniref:DUF2142 domain-containing protein n=1 Tax=Curtobacterium sp. MCBD17_003 TaxID=2175667 RepID=UPI000DAA5F71|nr:DUF2142 domain-containing protein [Curtobacterium sp. MCBD17_003]WIE53569.1 DUF2142 domain-containing protein [Curtobacterium sp. MCBD17_003]
MTAAERLPATAVVVPRPRVTRREVVVVAVVTLAFALLLVVWALVTPMFQAPDEAAHVDAVLHLALGGHWDAPGQLHYLNATRAAVDSAASTPPLQRPTVGALLAAHPGESVLVDQMSQHPPTYYLAAAVVLRILHLHDLRWDVAVVVLRLVDALLVAPLPVLVWATVRRLTRAPRLAAVAPFALFAVPQLAQIGSSVTNEAPVFLLGGLLTWFGVRILTGDRRWWTTLALGLTFAVLASVKATGLPAVLFVAVVVLAARALPWRARLARAGVALAIGVVLGSWWWVHCLVAFHTPLPNGLAGLTPVTPWPPGSTRNLGLFVDQQWDGLTRSFWGEFGGFQFPMTPILTDLLSLVALLAIAWSFTRRFPQRGAVVALGALPAAVLLAVVAYDWRSYGGLHQIGGTQGRFLFVALVAAIAMSAVAWSALVVRPVLRRRAARVLVVAAPAVGAYGLSVAYRGEYEQTNLGITRPGLAHLAYTTPLGSHALAVVGVLMAVAVVVAVVLAWRWCGLGSGRDTTGREAPPTPVPSVTATGPVTATDRLPDVD